MLNIPYSDINVRSLLTHGHDALQAEHAEKSEATRSFLRAGSSGIVDEQGRVFGECHRIAHLRQLGVEKPVAASRRLMFEAGETNEDSWERVLIPAWEGKLLRKQSATKQLGTHTVMGSPDIVLADASGVWRVVLELKLVSATNSALRRYCDGEPDSKHLIQSGVYAWLTGVPVVLCYTSRTDFSVEFQRKKYGIFKVEPFYRIFYITFKDDRLHYRDENTTVEVPTLVTGAAIERYYEQVGAMRESRELGERPVNDHVNGAEAAWDKCSPKYCTYGDVCNQYEHSGYETWVDAATNKAKEAV